MLGAPGRKVSRQVSIEINVPTYKNAKRIKKQSNHTIPPVLPAEAIKRVVFGARDHEIQDVRRHVQMESRQRVLHAEKVKRERIQADTYSFWDVWTKSEKYWVIDSPMNLYPQRFFPSIDYAFTFHLGLTQRIFARQRKGTDKDEFAPVWRRMDQAAEAAEFAEEAEDFQAVGMRCRECLIELVKTFINLKFVNRDKDSPKLADVVHWLEKVADGIASGAKSEEIRGYLKSLSKTTWQMVSWLTHATNATRFDSHFAIAGQDIWLPLIFQRSPEKVWGLKPAILNAILTVSSKYFALS